MLLKLIRISLHEELGMKETTSFNLEQSIQAIIENFCGPQAQAVVYERWDGGALNECYKVQAGGRLVFVKIEWERIFPSTRRGQIAREVHGIRMANAVGIRVPEILAYDQTGQEVGRKYLVESFIDGQLFWEIRDELSDAEWDALKIDVGELLEKMNRITSPVFGDVFAGGPIGQHASWKAAYQAMSDLLLADSRELGLFNAEEEEMVQSALLRGAGYLEPRGEASLYHGDLGLHNVMVDHSSGIARLGIVIDFGNSLFLPHYKNEEDIRKYGGFGVDVLDVTERFGIPQTEQEATNRLLWFGQVIFLGALNQQSDRFRAFREQFLDDCRKVASDL
jgi:aminoglycoside phosphotransferase (APT) family kinase protein